MKNFKLLAAASAFSLSILVTQAALALDVFSLGCTHYNKGNYALAKAYFAKAIADHPHYWPAHYNLANTYLKLEEYNNALTEYTVCLSICPDMKTRAYCARALQQIEGLKKGQSQVAMATSKSGTQKKDR